MSFRIRSMLVDRVKLVLCVLRFFRRFSLVSSCGNVFFRVVIVGRGMEERR